MSTARRSVGLSLLLLFALPFGLSVTGCGHHSTPVQYCNAGDSGPIVGQVATITLSPTLATTGESLNYGQMGVALGASAIDCKGNAVAVKAFTYSSTSSFNENASGGAIIADINPTNGEVCGGTWNRNTGGGIANYTTCTAPNPPPPVAQPVTLSLPAMLAPASSVAVGASPYTYTATAAGLLSVQGGTISSIATTGLTTTSGSYFVVPNETVTITYTVTPTMVSFTPAYTYTASSPGALQIAGGAVSAIYDYLAATGAATQEPSTSGIVSVNTNDIVAVFYTTAPKVVFIPSGVAALVTATASGATSNAIPIFVHSVATGVVLGGATADCTTDPGTDCCPNNTVGTPVVAPVYTGSSCLSQNQVGQLVGRVYANGNTDPADNVTCQVGHLTFAPQTAGIVSIDENGAATAGQPGSTVITATISNSSTATNAGYFATCPPASITLSDPTASNPVNVAINNLLPVTATVLDTNGNTITGLALEYNSTTPQTIPTTTGSVTPAYPGAADITAVCQPPTCNPSPFNQIGLFGNGKPVTSNPLTVTATGTSSTVLYMGSTSSQYVSFRDFTTNQPSALIKLPYVPNSMVINQAGTEIYFGSPEGLMSVATATNAVTAAIQTIPGIVLSVSPDGSTVVVTDPTRQTISLISTSGTADTVTTSYGGIGTSAAWSPDTQTVYITTGTLTAGATPTTITATPTITPSSAITPSPVVLTHSIFTDWQTATADEPYTDVAVAVPSVGAYFAGASTTDGRSYCSSSTIGTTGTPPTVTNTFIPLADQNAVSTQEVAATTDGLHILGADAAASGTATLDDIDITLPEDATPPSGACPTVIPATYFASTVNPQPLTGVSAATITGVFPSSNSAAAFVTYTGPSAAAPVGTTTGSLLPFYITPATGTGTLQYIALGNGASADVAPVSGVFSTDNFTFYVGTSDPDGTSADNDVHLITLAYPTGAAPTATETGILSPELPLATGTGYAPVNLIAQHPKKSTD